MAHIPLDILDAVFTELQPRDVPNTFCGGVEGPKKGLRSCTLVCREWRPLATSHMFRKVAYSFVYSLSPVLEARRLHAATAPCSPGARWTEPELEYDPESRIPIKSLAEFRDFLVNSPHICPRIRALHLDGYAQSDRVEEEWKCSPSLLVSIFDMLPNLQQLGLRNVAITPLSRSLRGLSTSVSPVVERPLRSVSVEYSSFQDGQRNILHRYTQIDAFELLKCFTEVDKVRLDISSGYSEPWDGDLDDNHDMEEHYVADDAARRDGEGQGGDRTVGTTSATLASKRTMRLRLRSLALGGKDSSFRKFLEALHKHPEVVRSIRQLRLLNLLPTKIPSVSWFLQETKGVLPLESLCIFPSMIIPLDNLDISVCSTLQSVELSLRLAYEDLYSCRCMLDILASFCKRFPFPPSRSSSSTFTSFVLKFRFVSYRSISESGSLSEEDITEIRGNLMDDGFVNFVERMRLGKISLKYSLEARARRDRVEETIKYMFPKLHEKGYLEATYVTDMYEE